ncbi:MAG: hypothetical protein HY900_05245, partial [Deltaproteobacteria bacterium]|nr:hypothetical protein [Deltaproteobacteria bacterium]
MLRLPFLAFLAILSIPLGSSLSAADAPLRAGFPVTLSGHGRVTFSSPVAADLDGDGAKE